MKNKKKENQIDRKIRTCISQVNMNDRTYHCEVFYPTLVNFFYGGNGSGKTTIARRLSSRKGLVWELNSNRAIMHMVFDEDYIRNNIVCYDKLPGVFTLSSEDADIRTRLITATNEKKEITNDLADKNKRLKEIIGQKTFLNAEYYSKVWERTKALREEDFPKSQDGYKSSKQKFFDELRRHMCVRIDFYELHTAYERVFSLNTYTPYRPIDRNCFPSEPDVLRKSFISQSSTEFAHFIRALGNLDWVKEGKELYLHEDKCPFCQSKINKNELIRNITACFDEQYQEDFVRLKEFAEQYSDAYSMIRNALEVNIDNPFPISDIQKQNYQYYTEMFINKGRNNIIFLEQKLREPSLLLTSNEFEDLSPYLQKLSKYTDDINSSMTDYLQSSGFSAQKSTVLNRIWSFMAYECKDLLEVYENKKQQLDYKEKEFSEEIANLNERLLECDAVIDELSAYTTNTHVVMREINKTLLAIGFRGFYLQEKIDEPYTYELIREDEKGNKELAQGLSEGERNFIAFLYFYHTATGSQNRDGSMDDRIVIIDDPVSSMDQQTMFFVATLTRNLIDICLNNVRLKEYDQDDTTDKYIKQFFCFTHNAVFFREITYNRINDYEAVSFFEITKDKENHSHIDETYELKDGIGDERINRSPVRNYYESLWHVFRTTENIDMLMIVAHQILSHHFLQSEGYDAEDFRRILFVGENKSEFMQRKADGSIDQTYYNIAVSIINMLDVSISSYNDGMYFSSSIYTSEQIREAFRIIFETMGRISHYNMMMRRK